MQGCQHRSWNWIATAVLSAASFGFEAAPALAQCLGFNQLEVSVNGAPTISNYDPFSGSGSEHSFNVSIRNPSADSCNVAISFHRPAGLPATMSSGSSTLGYSLERLGNGLPIITQNGFVPLSSPPANRRHNFGVIPRSRSRNRNVNFVISPGQVVAAGQYSDPNITMILVGLNDSGQPEQSRPVSISLPQAAVVSKCSLPPPSLSNLDLTTAISNGRPNEGVTRTTTFSNVQCTAPTKLRLTGAALQPTSPTGPRAGFDNFINFRAVGTFGSASTTLTTTTTEQSADSAQKNVADGATTAGQIDVVVNLVNGQPILAGTYSGILTVSIDPAF